MCRITACDLAGRCCLNHTFMCARSAQQGDTIDVFKLIVDVQKVHHALSSSLVDMCKDVTKIKEFSPQHPRSELRGKRNKGAPTQGSFVWARGTFSRDTCHRDNELRDVSRKCFTNTYRGRHRFLSDQLGTCVTLAEVQQHYAAYVKTLLRGLTLN